LVEWEKLFAIGVAVIILDLVFHPMKILYEQSPESTHNTIKNLIKVIQKNLIFLIMNFPYKLFFKLKK